MALTDTFTKNCKHKGSAAGEKYADDQVDVILLVPLKPLPAVPM